MKIHGTTDKKSPRENETKLNKKKMGQILNQVKLIKSIKLVVSFVGPQLH